MAVLAAPAPREVGAKACRCTPKYSILESIQPHPICVRQKQCAYHRPSKRWDDLEADLEAVVMERGDLFRICHNICESGFKSVPPFASTVI